MSDATLPQPRSSSEAPATVDSNRYDSSTGEGDSDTSLIQTESLDMKEEGPGDDEGKLDSKQKRKRTR